MRKYPLELLRDVIWLEKSTHLIDTDKIQISHILVAAAKYPLIHLPVADVEQVLICVFAQRQASITVNCFCRVLSDYGLNLIPLLFLHYGSANMNPAVLIS